jgi:hypothetical protein
LPRNRRIDSENAVAKAELQSMYPSPKPLGRWHAGQYDLGKEQLLRGTSVQPAYAPVCAEKGLVTLAIDCWCFGERKREEVGRQGEEDTFKLMLWRGQVLWGMMMFDELRALSYLASRPEVDPARVGAFGMSMGARAQISATFLS